MNAHEFHQSRKFATTPFGRIAYVERGSGPSALLLHGFPLNGFEWRRVLEDLAAIRRCIAPDMMGLGYSEIRPGQDLSFLQQARMIESFLDALKIDRIDLVGNDSGGGISQMFAAHYPCRLRTLTLTNCEVYDLWPNQTLRAVLEMARGEPGIAAFKPMLDDPSLARNSFSLAYEDSNKIDDDTIRTYLKPLLATEESIANARAFVCFERDREQLVSAAPQLKAFKAPTQVIWGDGDVYFELGSVDWLKQNIAGLRTVIMVPGARLFFPDEHPKLVSVLLREFWRSMS